MNRYKIHYPHRNVTQYKVLIPHTDYVAATLLVDEDGEFDNAAYKKVMKQLSGGEEWFTDKSPLHDAITTGEVMIYDGSYLPCVITIDN